MEDRIYNQLITEIPEREKHISRYYPFFSIIYKFRSEKCKYNSMKNYIPSIVISILSFMLYEGKLKERELFFDDIYSFLSKILLEQFKCKFDYEYMTEFTVYILDAISNGGVKFSYEYENPLTNKASKEVFHYVESEFDKIKGTNKYWLSKEGIEFLLNTKEFGDESRISIYLLLVQKQLKNNNLQQVLNNLVSVNMEIKKEIEEKQELIELLAYSYDDKYDEYIKYKDKVFIRLNEEKELFDITKQQIVAYEEEYFNNMTKSEMIKIREAPYLLESIKRELEKNISNHRILIGSVSDLINEIPNIRVDRMKRLFENNFTFENKFNQILKADDVSLISYLLLPLFKPNLKREFNIDLISNIFNYSRKEDTRLEYNEQRNDIVPQYVITIENRIESCFKNRMAVYMEYFLDFLLLENKEKSELRTFCEYLYQNCNEEDIFSNDLIIFILSILKINNDSHLLSYNDLICESNLKEIYNVYVDTINKNKRYHVFKNVTLICTPVEDNDDEVCIKDCIKIKNINIEVMNKSYE